MTKTMVLPTGAVHEGHSWRPGEGREKEDQGGGGSLCVGGPHVKPNSLAANKKKHTKSPPLA